jgi:hypothetical protein
MGDSRSESLCRYLHKEWPHTKAARIAVNMQARGPKLGLKK